jgi:vitamin-K-epoxide reductase (warfarin-sensitive)
MQKRTETTLRIVIGVLAIIGIALSLYLLKEHLAPTGNSFCNMNSTINCDVVNKSVYAELFGIPVSLLGVFFWFGVFCVALIPQRLTKLIALGDKRLFYQAFLGYMSFGFAFSAYLTAIEAFVLTVWCPFCVVSAINVTIILGIAVYLARAKY